MIQLNVYWKYDEFYPAIYVGDVHGIFMLWMNLNKHEKVLKTEMRATADGRKIDPLQGIPGVYAQLTVGFRLR